MSFVVLLMLYIGYHRRPAMKHPPLLWRARWAHVHQGTPIVAARVIQMVRGIRKKRRSSTDNKCGSAITVADKERVLKPLRLTALPLVLPGRECSIIPNPAQLLAGESC